MKRLIAASLKRISWRNGIATSKSTTGNEEEAKRRLLAGQASLKEGLALYTRITSRGEDFTPELEEAVLKLGLQAEPQRQDLMARLRTVLVDQGKFVPNEVEQAFARQAADHERPTSHPHDGIFYVFALPKSASRSVYRTLLKMQSEYHRVPLATLPRPVTWPQWPGVNADVRPDFLETLPRGMLHSHAGALPGSISVLRRYGERHIVMVRHPADHLAALYCHLRRFSFDAAAGSTITPVILDPAKLREIRSQPPRSHHVIHPVHLDCIGNGANVEDAFDHLIQDGYLIAALDWLANWVRFADPHLTKIVRYEDLLDQPEALTADMYRFLWRKEPERFLNPLVELPEAPEAIYPRGTTARVGVWRNYLSASNADAYNNVVIKWRALHGEALDSLYPNLILPT